MDWRANSGLHDDASRDEPPWRDRRQFSKIVPLTGMPHKITLAVVPSSDNQVRMIRGVMQYAAETGRIQITKRAAIPYVPIELLDKVAAEGIIAYAESQGRIDFLKSLGMPFVNLTLHAEPEAGVPVVHSDNFELGRRLAEHLLTLGLRNFAFVGHFAWHHNRMRQEGFRQRLAESGFDAASIDIAFESETSLETINRQVHQGALQHAIEQLPEPCGVGSCHDEFAHEIVEACKAIGRSVPHSVSVIGVNDYRLICETTTPQLSSVAQNSERIGYLAAQLVDQLIEGAELPAGPILVPPGQLIVRRSSQFLALEDADVVAAIEFIRDRCHRPITVTDVVDHLQLGRKTLEKRFKNAIGHSIAHEIRLSRMRHAQHLLTSTPLSIVDVAIRSGFDSTSGFIRAFREHTGVTPADYRKG
ncbi:substrate-binding domain-containing protein [Blastopirellula sp. JC732]|uniref:Substrate-binding domain-containing protein n=1 Tax=Blastopirellula sediminis TaxID=2894196 RepID=A0A9X1SFS4_9BACT|nr:substrate-binding domain-containing protein [Blastopirellula sediminis]MCC9609161.1 substrate-binding domain-containing protein [Blastopirellula sediminis]MCC9628062.1 substrate-binding domain-containing protein [Blastopirellula sediminis]